LYPVVEGEYLVAVIPPPGLSCHFLVTFFRQFDPSSEDLLALFSQTLLREILRVPMFVLHPWVL